jgi:hypothetical protein
MMPVTDPGLTWQEGLAAFGVIAVVAFLVTWVLTDLLKVRRTPYIALLFVVAVGLGAWYCAWSGTTASELFTSGAGWALVAGLVAAAVAFPLVRRLPAHPHATRGRLAGLMLWEGVVYGIAEAVLLSTLPVLAVWQMCDALGWTDGGWARIGSGTLAIAGSLFVILVHHLGYAEFRTRARRQALFGAMAVCGVQAVAFLATGNALAPIVAHIVLHGELLVRGEELPPAVRRQPALQT